MSICRVCFLAMTLAASTGFPLGIFKARAKSFVVPVGITAICGRFLSGAIPETTSLIVPSPPAAMTRSKPALAARVASFLAEFSSGVV